MFGLLPAALLILALTAPLSAQITFQRTYGGTEHDRGHSVAQTADGGYIITGCTYSFGAGDCDVWLIKTDASGDTIWTRTFGGTDWDWGESVEQTTDGGYVIVGFSNSYGIGECDAWLIKTGANGDTIWTRTFGGGNYDCGYSVAQTADSGYIIAGETWSFGAGYCDVYLVKTDASGDTMWTRVYGGADADWGWSVTQTADDGYVIVGYTCSFGAGLYDAWLIKTDVSGDTTWTCTYGGSNGDLCYSVAQTADGGYVIAGYTDSFGAGGGDVYLIKTDANGNVAIAEPKPPVAFEPVGATIARAVLNLQSEICNQQSKILLLNSVGRKVMVLQPGENDVRHLAPGVYFLRGRGSRVQGSEGPSRKVILTR